ncbi:MAG: prepilin-type N-terminal cleavage/methylation domain-containing protein [Armatimonadota bacterium]
MNWISKKNGFSMIELLTVIAIIAILAAIIFPVMGMVRERAKQNQCMTNLKQIAMGAQMFKQDNRRYPLTLGPQAYVEVGGTAKKWVEATDQTPLLFENTKSYAGKESLFPEYVNTIQIFHCPATKTTNSQDISVYQLEGIDVAVYTYNSYDSFLISTTPDGNVGPANIFQNNVEPRYVRKWAGNVAQVATLPPYPPGTNDSPSIQQQDYERQLFWRNPPGDTVLTWCSYHEGSDLKGRSIVVFVDGHVDQIPAREVNESRWRVRPKKS